MHNMLEEYYNFLCERLISWAKFSDLSVGDRFVLSFENKDQVKGFVNELSNTAGVNKFKIPNEHGSVFWGLSYQLKHNGGMKLVVVSTNDVTPAYLVSLRNQIGQQKGVWKNTAILFVSDKILDSINSGAKDISRQGGPFNLNELRKNLNNEILNSPNLNSKDKDSLHYMVQGIFDDDQTYTLMDFADIYSVIEKGKLDPIDFNQMGYFYDDDLNTYPNIKKRLAENHMDFEKISRLHGYGDVKDRIAKVVAGDSLINELSKDDWQNVNYRKIQSGKDKLKEQSNIKLEYLADDLKQKNSELMIWDKPENANTKAGSRKRNIIVFNPDQLGELSIKIPFDQSVKSKWITSKKIFDVVGLAVSVAGDNFVLHFTKLDKKNSKSVQLIYKHQNKGSLSFSFNIFILPFSSELIESIRPFYKLSLQKNHAFSINLPSDIDGFCIGNGLNNRNIGIHSVKDLNGQVIDSDESLKIDTTELGFNDDSKDPFEMIISGVPINFVLMDDDSKIQPKSAISLENFRRQHKIDGHFENEKVIFGETISSVYRNQKSFLGYEEKAIRDDLLSGVRSELEISPILISKYKTLFEILRSRNTIMSLVYWDSEIKDAVEAIVNEVQSEIDSSTEKIELSESTKNISHIGEYIVDGNITFAPFNPILLSYQLKVEQKIGTERLSEKVQQKLNPYHLAPFLKRSDVNYKAFYNSDAPRWLVYSESQLSRFGSTSQAIVTERLKDFKNHFDYLFEMNSSDSYNIKFVNVTDDKSVLKSIIDYLTFEIENSIKKKKNINDINPVNAFIVGKNKNIVGSTFNSFYKIVNNEEFGDFFSESLKVKGVTNDEIVEIIEVIKKKLNIIFGSKDNITYHITFYQFSNGLTLNSYNSEELDMNYSMEGLIGGDEYTNTQDSIREGFGTKGLKTDSSLLNFAKSWNELLVATNGRHDVMTHGQTLTNSVEELDSKSFQSQFDKSKWVTLLNPEVRLDYFNKMSNNIYVIHYTDYTNSANYESITLTKQVKQYENILSENLPKIIDKREDTSYLSNIIKSFNVINGEWLLRLVSHRNQRNTVKEKLSILATYKEMLGILHDPDIIWIPLSLEEILRVSGSFVGESRDSIFSAKSLGAKGRISDDLLFIGLWKQDDKYKVTFLPTEVKVGLNSGTTIKKADIQVEKTYDVFDKELNHEDDFKSQFYLDFFMKLFFANSAKLFSNNDMTQSEYDRIQEYKNSIIQGNLEVDNSLTDFYKNKFVFSLKADNNNRSIQINDKYALVEVPELDAFVYSGVDTDEVIKLVQEGKFGFDDKRLLNKVNSNVSQVRSFEKAESDNLGSNDKLEDSVFSKTDNEDKKVDDSEKISEDTLRNDELLKLSDDVNIDDSQAEVVKKSENETISDRRILLGTVDGSNNKDYWEYDNHQLANRHMLITGKSGQGKTYFIQTLLLELSKSKIDSLVIDYTDSYLPEQLDPILKNEANIKQHIVMKEKLPINPFKKSELIIDDFHKFEDTKDVVSRVAEVLTFIFGLGIRQKGRLIAVMNEGINTTPNYTFSSLENQLLNSNDSISQGLYGRIQPLLDNDPFSYDDSFSWKEYFGNTGQINIIQLSKYVYTVQNAMIEFILWDLFNYSQINSNLKLTYPVFLDEVQNLNFAKGTPTVKILREGRKFGWSGIFATQSLSSIKGEDDAIYNTAEQVHFLPPENQTKAISKMLSSDRRIQNEYEAKLTNLKKGQCIVNGSIKDLTGNLVKNIDVVNIDSLSDRL